MFADGRYRLFVQHRSDAPAFQATGWARFSSDDLLQWEWDGPVLPPTPDDWAYSGSLVSDGMGRLEAHHTLHAAGAAESRERQACAVSSDAGLTWTSGGAVAAPAGRNVRDPFVFAWEGEWRMLLARPCDWSDWPGQGPSVLQVLASPDRRTWTPAGFIGPWAPEGVMWEVPVLVPFGGTWALIVSVVDRRSGDADCGVRYWLGRFDGSGFTPKPESTAWGLPLDFGPDFYAAIANTAKGWPGAPMIVAWASNWRTARRIPWPGGFSGGPITVPRTLQLTPSGDRLRQTPLAAAKPQSVASWTGGSLRIGAGDAELRLDAVPGATGRALTVTRTGPGELAWRRSWELPADCDLTGDVTVFRDGPLVELFLQRDALWITAVLPGAAADIG